MSALIQPEVSFAALQTLIRKQGTALRIGDVLAILEHVEAFDEIARIVKKAECEKSIRNYILCFFLERRKCAFETCSLEH